MKRRTLCVAAPALAVLAAFALAACSKAPAPQAPAATAPAAAAPQAANTEEKVLNFYNWADYIPANMVADFEKETGIKVNYQTFENNEGLHAKLVAGDSGFDLVVPGAVFAKSQIDLPFPDDGNAVVDVPHDTPVINIPVTNLDVFCLVESLAGHVVPPKAPVADLYGPRQRFSYDA